jgi:RNA polymerase sigma factor (sigma-70 family)
VLGETEAMRRATGVRLRAARAFIQRDSAMTTRHPIDLPIPVAAARPSAIVPDEEALSIRRLQSGDFSAIDELYALHAAGLLRLSSRLCGSRHDAEDVVHDVFVALPKALRRYEHRGQFGAWLRTLVINRVTDRARTVSRRRERSLDAALDRQAPPVLDDAIDTTLEAAIAALPDSLRIVFVLRAVEDCSHAEIGRMLGIRTGTSEVRYWRAIRRLRRVLEERREGRS